MRKRSAALRLLVMRVRWAEPLPCVMNAANEIAVAAFLSERGSYLGIAECVEAVMSEHESQGVQKVESIEQLQALDAWARAEAEKHIR